MTPTSSRVKAFRLQKTYVTLVIPETAVNPPPTHAGTFPQPPTHARAQNDRRPSLFGPPAHLSRPFRSSILDVFSRAGSFSSAATSGRAYF
jgi:hypothetical protein